MTVIVNTGSTLTVTQANGLTLTADSAIETFGCLNGAGTVTGPFALINDGFIESSVQNQTLEIDSAAFTNSGFVMTGPGDTRLLIASSVAVSNFSNGTLTGGAWDVTNNSSLLWARGRRHGVNSFRWRTTREVDRPSRGRLPPATKSRCDISGTHHRRRVYRGTAAT